MNLLNGINDALNMIYNNNKYFLALYVLLSSMLGRVHPCSIISAVAVSPNILLVPYLVGNSFLSIFRRVYHKGVSSWFLISFLTGSILLHAFFVLAEFFEFKIEISAFVLVIIGIIIVGFVIDIIRRINSLKGEVQHNEMNSMEKKVDMGLAVSILITFLIAILAFYIPKIRVPFPLVSFDGAVGHETLKPVTRLLNDGVLDVYRTRGLPVILQAIVCIFSNVPILNLSWTAPLSTSLLFAFSMFSLSHTFAKKKIIALASVLLAFFINSAGVGMFDTVNFIFRYITILIAVFPLVIQEVYSNFVNVKNERIRLKKHIILLSFGSLFLVAVLNIFEHLKPDFLVYFFKVNEFLRPFLYIPFLGFTLVYTCRLKNQALKNLILLLSASTAFFVLLDIHRPAIFILFLYFFLLLLDQVDLRKMNLQLIIGVHKLKKGVSRRIKFSIPWSTKINILRTISFLLILWLVLLLNGCLIFEEYVLFNGQLVSKVYHATAATTSIKLNSLITANSVYVLMFSLFLSIILLFSSRMEEFVSAFSFIVCMFVYFLPILETRNIPNEFLRIFMALTISMGVFNLVMFLNKFIRLYSRNLKIGFKIPIKSSVIVFLLMISTVFYPVFNASFTRFTSTPVGSDYASLLTDYELETLKNCLSNCSEDARIISDPFTMIYLSSYINHIALIGASMPPYSKQDEGVIIEIWDNIFHGNSSSEIHSRIMKLKDIMPDGEKRFNQRTEKPMNLSKFIVIVSGRTAWWLDHNDPLGWYTLFPHTYNVSKLHITHFLDPRYFTLMYKIDRKMYVFLFEEKKVTLSPVTENSILYWSLDDIADSKIEDESVYKNNGTIYGTVSVDGKVNKALSFDGIDDYISCSSVAGLNRSALTFMFWSKQIGTQSHYMSQIGIFGEYRALVYIRPDTYQYCYRFGSINGTNYYGDIATLDGDWHFIAVTFDGAQIKCYVEGVHRVTADAQGSITGGDESLFIGNIGTGITPASNWFYGIIDEVRIYNRALTAEEIFNNYLCGW